MRVERVLLIRHGQTDWNMEGRWQGRLSVPLNAIGRAQAQALAEHLRGRPIRAIYSSDLSRAWETAVAIGAALGVEPQPEERLREFDLGIFQGFTREESLRQYPDEWAAFHADPWDYVVPNGESRRLMQTRMWQAWEDIVARDEGPEVVLVTHGGALAPLLMKIFGETPEIKSLRFENTSVTAVERHGDGWRLAEVAVVTHLDNLDEMAVTGEIHSPSDHQAL
ncbi:MAG TPA: histidine phosphatase family protein [Phototrophicaceae bacterium]|nr:histidine phosphatase family protein [Phototrophicaceae bacterium]